MPTNFDRPIAHRGYHDRANGIIENSASAFAAAMAAGFALECDLQLTGEDEAIVFHDDDTDRLLGRAGRVSRLSTRVLGAAPLLGSAADDRPQIFAELLDQVGGRTLIVAELKDQHDKARNTALAQRALAVSRGYKGPLVFKSFHPGILAALRAAGFGGPTGIVTYGYDRPEWDGALPPHQRFILRHLLHRPVSRFSFISCEQSALTLPMVRLARSRGMKVMTWTIRDAAAAARAQPHADQIVFEGFDPRQASEKAGTHR